MSNWTPSSIIYFGNVSTTFGDLCQSNQRWDYHSSSDIYLSLIPNIDNVTGNDGGNIHCLFLKDCLQVKVWGSVTHFAANNVFEVLK